jgi:glycosyltransferase involved in cell wall biosynthesis
MRIAVVNDARSQLGERTFWDDLIEWFSADFIGGDFNSLAEKASGTDHDLLIRNCSYFKPIETKPCPQIALLQDIFPDGPMREMQFKVIDSSKAVVFNSEFTMSKYDMKQGPADSVCGDGIVIPLPIDFSVFEPGNAMGLQQELALPDGCVCWVGASQGAAGQVKGWDIFLNIVRLNPDIPFVAVVKDAFPDTVPPNLRVYCRLKHDELVKVIGACRVGLCTSRTESQHLAGIEMGACGLPLVVPNTGTYWNRSVWPGMTVMTDSPSAYTTALRSRPEFSSPDGIRDYWEKEFSKEVVRAQWEKLVAEVENAHSDKV